MMLTARFGMMCVAAAGSLVFAAEYIDDRVLGKAFETKMEALVDGEAFPDFSEMMAQLPGLTNPVPGLSLAELRLKEQEPGPFYEARRPEVFAVGSFYKCDRCPKWHNSIAGGFPITSDGVFVTNYHVVEGHPERTAGVGVMDSTGNVWPMIEILAGHEADDIAIIRVDAGDHVFTALPIAPDPEIGDQVRCISHPNRRFYSYTQGQVSRFFFKYVDDQPVARMAITADYAKGSSGSGIFDVRGNIVGMVSETNALTYKKDNKAGTEITQMVVKSAVPASSIRKLIKTLPPM